MRWREATVAAALIGAGLLGVFALVRGFEEGPPSEQRIAPWSQGDDPDPPKREERADGAVGSDGPDTWAEIDAFQEEGSIRLEGSVEDVASQLVEERRDAGECLLVHAGYLDFTGRVWGCVLQGNRWVEICLIEEETDGTWCSARIWRMDAGEISRDLGV